MRKAIFLIGFMIISLGLFGQYGVGDVIDQDYDWTDSNGEYHSLHELIASGKAVIIFWGESW